MPWVFENRKFDAPERLKRLLEKQAIIKIPGVFNALIGMIAKKEGFQALYVSGAAFSASQGLPDLGYFNIENLASYVRNLYRAVDLPLIVDADTGFGEAMHLPHTIMELEEAGAAAIQIEDQDLPKKCGHLEGKTLISIQNMCQKLQAAKKTRKNLLIIARTDAYSLFGMDEAVKRANAYIEAGCDIVFPESLDTEEAFSEFAKKVSIPLLANMTEFGKTPYYTAEMFQKWGYKIVIYPVTTLRIAMKAVEKVLQLIQKEGTQRNLIEHMQTRKELYDLLDYDSYGEFDETVAGSAINIK